MFDRYRLPSHRRNVYLTEAIYLNHAPWQVDSRVRCTRRTDRIEILIGSGRRRYLRWCGLAPPPVNPLVMYNRRGTDNTVDIIYL